MTEIVIYVEGGGDTAGQKAELRQGFDGLLKEQKSAACRKRLRWKLVPCGGRVAAYDAFVNAAATQPAKLHVLLVDSERGVPARTGDAAQDAAARVDHLVAQDGWRRLADTPAERVHLMVQCMEAWLVADPAALAKFYGQGFREDVLPARPNLEEEPKKDLYDKLERATAATQKRAYAKIRHARHLLGRVNSERVADRCPHFSTFIDWLTKTIQET